VEVQRDQIGTKDKDKDKEARLKHLLVGSEGKETGQQHNQEMENPEESNGKDRGSIEKLYVQEEQQKSEYQVHQEE
jgi:hypothetical protein